MPLYADNFNCKVNVFILQVTFELIYRTYYLLLLFTPLLKNGSATKIIRFAMHKNGKMPFRVNNSGFPGKYARKHLAGY